MGGWRGYGYAGKGGMNGWTDERIVLVDHRVARSTVSEKDRCIVHNRSKLFLARLSLIEPETYKNRILKVIKILACCLGFSGCRAFSPVLLSFLH
jgi:hypothetical protein